MNGGTNRKQCDSLIFRESGKNFRIENDPLKMLTENNFKEPKSPDAKFMIDFLAERNSE